MYKSPNVTGRACLQTGIPNIEASSAFVGTICVCVCVIYGLKRILNKRRSERRERMTVKNTTKTFYNQ